ncbi:MAG: GTP-binding protein [Candidatus Parvarchaeota archaeon]|jgi:small GTP-binding protein|nr:GTP-binding protein [Candidatus Parvarchaeota archaeon]MCL5106943.1 GTP-binding protein [Candidatus Parvarchaeota archaeon]
MVEYKGLDGIQENDVDPYFGIAKLDEQLKGIPSKKLVLISASPSVGNEVFGYQIIHKNITSGVKVLILLNRTSPQSYLTEMKEYDFPANDNMCIIDAYSGITGIKSDETDHIKVISNPYDKEEVKTKVLKELDNGYGLLVVDSLSLLADFFDFSFAISFMNDIKKAVIGKDSAAVLLFTDWGYEKENVDKLLSNVNSTIEVKGIEKRVIFGQYFAVLNCDWVGEKQAFSSVLFKAIKPGGIKVYFPKILVTGPTDAGKSSFIHSASRNAVSVDKLGGTIALDHGSVDFQGYRADLFGTPGQERFDPLLKMLGGEAIGVFLVVDSTKPEQFPRAVEMLRKTETYGLPVVVIANKADLKGALKKEEIREKLHLDSAIALVQTVAEDLSKVDPNQPTKLKENGITEALSSLFKQLT